MRPVTNEQLAMIGAWLQFVGQMPKPTFTLRDIVLLRRQRGRMLLCEASKVYFPELDENEKA